MRKRGNTPKLQQAKESPLSEQDNAELLEAAEKSPPYTGSVQVYNSIEEMSAALGKDHSEPSIITHAEARNATEPFGFKAGMTQTQVITIVGNGAVSKQSDDTLVLTSAPKAYPDCDEYVLRFSPTKGLLKVVATTRTIRVNEEGDSLRDEFKKIVDILTAKYGKPEKYNFVHNNVEADPRFWMMSLYDKERTLAAAWNYGENGHGGDTTTGIFVQAVALRIDEGYVSIGYEFPGWNTYMDERKAKANSSF